MTDLPTNFSIKRWPEGERPREKLIQYGAESLTDADLRNAGAIIDGGNL